MNDLEKIIKLRKELHRIPEASMHESKTKKCLMNFISENTNISIVDKDKWFYAYYKGTNEFDPIAFRADYDAVICKEGKASHSCGHDGHSAILAGLALFIEEIKPERDVYLIFQPGEETGEGAKICKEIIKEKSIKEIYAFHNIPGYETGEVILLNETFACASTGMEIIIKGRESHAAYPEEGRNPSKIIAETIIYLDELLKKESNGIILGTVIGADIGSNSYGVSAGEAKLRLTLRAEYQEEYELLIKDISDYVFKKSKENDMECVIRFIEEFPATKNNPDCVKKIEKAVTDLNLKSVYPKEPFRWSEDFGYYLNETRGAMFGVGCGIDHAGLHTDIYEFNDEIIKEVIGIYKEIIMQEND